jgi:hypothetical protein
MKKVLKIVPYIIIAILVGVSVSYAGTLTPPGSPAKTMETLSDLYQLTNTGANTPSNSFTTPGSVSATMNSISDIYNLMTTKIAAIDVTKVQTGTTIFGKAGTAYPSKQLVTNQTICYDASGSVIACSGTGQDGELLKGVARSYTDNGNGTITDNSTGLIWQKQDDAVTRNWALALTYCNTNAAGLPGTGWRLPNVYELYTLVDFGVAAAPFINLTYFPATQSNVYWSSTSRPGSFTVALLVSFGNGNANGGTKTSTFYVRCVRG